MYKKQDVAQLKKEFWTTLGQYLAPMPSASGNPINWINYKTGVKGIFFRMDATAELASVSIEISMDDEERRIQLYNKMKAFQTSLENTMGEDWEWKETITDEHGSKRSEVIRSMSGVNILDKNRWPPMIAFFKQRMAALDLFWNESRDFFTD